MRVLPSFISESDLRQKPIEKADTIPSRWYTNPAMSGIEQSAIFDREWQLAGHVSEIPEPGDSLCKTIAGSPVLIVRDQEKAIRAYFNVCKHRGGPVEVKKGTTTVLQCRYHGWTYLMDGSLRGVPQWDRVDLFDKKDFGLTPVAIEFWQGLIFINTSENPPAFSPVVRGISERISPVNFEPFRFYKKVSYPVQCNWKVYADNYLEGYHIPVVHPELAKLLDYRNYITEADEYHSLQYSPFLDKGNGNLYGAEDGEAWYYFIYPNMMLNILPGRLQTNVILPVDEENCIVEFYYYYLNPEKPGFREMVADDLDYSETIQQEDIEICEAVQRGLRSKAYDKGRFSVERELGVYHFQSCLKNSLRRYFHTGSEVA